MIELVINKQLLGAEGVMNLQFDAKLKSGEIIGLFGPSGSGKTTFLRILAGFENEFEGKVVFNGKIWKDTAQNRFESIAKREIGYVHEDFGLYPNMSIKRHLDFTSKNENIEFQGFVLNKFGLSSIINHKPHQLSAGQKQRLALARAIINKPQLLLLDEPFSALDISLKREIISFLKAFQKENGTTIFFATHSQMTINLFADKLLFFNNGKVTQESQPKIIEKSIIIKSKIIGIENIHDGISVLTLSHQDSVFQKEYRGLSEKIKIGDWIHVELVPKI